jgi:hypothetical protein
MFKYRVVIQTRDQFIFFFFFRGRLVARTTMQIGEMAKKRQLIILQMQKITHFRRG